MQRYQLNLLVSIFILVFANTALFRHIADSYPSSLWTTAFMVSLGCLLAGLTLVLLTLLESKYLIRPLLITVLLITALAACAMDCHNIVIDAATISRLLEADWRELISLVNQKVLIYLLILGVLPALFVARAKLVHPPFTSALTGRMKVVLVTLLVIAVQIPVFGKHYESLVREHSALRYYSNPLAWLWSSGEFLAAGNSMADTAGSPRGVDVAIRETGRDQPAHSADTVGSGQLVP